MLGHVLARMAAGRLMELAPVERQAVESCAAHLDAAFPAEATALRALVRSLPEYEARSAAELWERGAPVDPDQEHHQPISHGRNNGEAEERTLARLRLSPGKLGTKRIKVLGALGKITETDGPISAIDLANRLGTTRDSIHPRMMELEAGGWAERHGVNAQGRVLFRASPKGLAWLRERGAL